MFQPKPRLPVWNITHTRPFSSTCISVKWLPPPEAAQLLALLVGLLGDVHPVILHRDEVALGGGGIAAQGLGAVAHHLGEGARVNLALLLHPARAHAHRDALGHLVDPLAAFGGVRHVLGHEARLQLHHAAADVVAGRGGQQDALRLHHRADGHAVAHVAVGRHRHAGHARERGRVDHLIEHRLLQAQGLRALAPQELVGEEQVRVHPHRLRLGQHEVPLADLLQPLHPAHDVLLP